MKPPDRKRFLTSPEEWLAHARSDLKLARLGSANEDILPEQLCFHAQQAAEKALKAVLLYSKVEFPLTHDLEELVDISEQAGIQLTQDLPDLAILTPYAVETRYPGYWEAITGPDVEEALNLADGVLKWAEDFISKK